MSVYSLVCPPGDKQFVSPPGTKFLIYMWGKGKHTRGGQFYITEGGQNFTLEMLVAMIMLMKRWM